MKKILSILLICIFVLSMPLCAYADESAVEDEYTRYYIKALCSYSKNDDYTIGYYYDVAFNIDKKLVGYVNSNDESCRIKLLLFDETGVIRDAGIFLQNINGYCNFSVEPNGTTISGKYIYEYDGSTFNFFSVDYENVNKGETELKWGTSKIEDSGFINTNIPYFSTQEECMAYINGEIGVESALNSSEIIEHAYDSERVPLPLDFKILYENSRYYLVWEYSSEDLEKISKVKIDVINEKFYARVHTLKDYIENPIDYEIDFSNVYEPQLANKIDITKEVNGLREYIEEKYYKHDLQFEIHFTLEGIWKLSDVKILHSNKVHAVMTIEKTDEGGLSTDCDSYITDKDNNVLDDYYLLGPPKEIDVGYISGDSGTFLGYLFNGFGMLGDNGFLACCKAIFGCFPSFVWDLLSAGLSAAIVVFLIKLLFH